MIKLMPLAEVKTEIKKLSQAQVEELVDYAIFHYQDLSMDRVDLFSRLSGKNVMEAIKNYKLSQEG
jgi:Mor family transcriptional regulator